MSGSQNDLFRAMFLEEAHELLAALETGLAGLEPAQADRSRLDQAYRAAHSLKGAAAMVGFAAIADLAQQMEKALGQVRSGKEAWTAELARLLAADRLRLEEMVRSEQDRAGELAG